MDKRPFFVLGASSFCAALLFTRLSMTAAFVGCVVLLAICLIAAFLPWKRRLCRTVAAAAFAAAVCGGLFLAKEIWIVRPQLALDGQMMTLTARVQETIGEGAYIVQVEDGALRGKRLALWINERENACEVGEQVCGEVTLTAAFEDNGFFDGAYARAQGVYLYAWSSGEPLVRQDGADSLPLYSRALVSLRSGIRQALYRYLDSSHAALCESLLLGQRDALDSSVAQAFRESGVYHLLVVSGLHLSIVTGALLWLLRKLRLPRRARAGVAIGGVLLFMALCGFSPSVLRAGIMTILALLATMLRREADGLNSLGAAAFLMLLCDPFAVYDIGMQLSFAATLGLLLGLPVWEREVTAKAFARHERLHRAVSPLLTAVGVSLCATLMTMPLTALYFGYVSLVFLPTNLLCVLPATVLLVLLFAAVALSAVPFLSEVVFWGVRLLGDWLLLCTSVLSSLPFATVSAAPYAVAWLFLAAFALLAAYALCRMRGVRRLLPLLVIALLCGVSVSNAAMSGTVSVAAARSETPAVLLMEDGQAALLFRGDSKALSRAQELLEREGVKSLQWVLWLNEPSVQAMELSDFSTAIEELFLIAPREQYAGLPTAAHYITLASGDGFCFWQDGSMFSQDGFYRLCFGDTSLLLCPNEGDVLTLPSEWLQSSIVVYDTAAPLHATAITAQYGVWFCSRDDLSLAQKAVPYGAYDIATPVSDGTLALMTRGWGDVTLRWY